MVQMIAQSLVVTEDSSLGLRTHDAAGGPLKLLVSPTKTCKFAAKILAVDPAVKVGERTVIGHGVAVWVALVRLSVGTSRT